MADIDNMLYGPLVAFKALLATSQAFQRFANVAAEDIGQTAGATAAAARIHFPAIPGEDIEDLRPYCQYDYGDEMELYRDSSTGMAASHSIRAVFEADIPAEHRGDSMVQQTAAHRWFSLLMGDIVAYLAGYNAAGLHVLGMTMESPPARPEVRNEGEYFSCRLLLRCGFGEGE